MTPAQALQNVSGNLSSMLSNMLGQKIQLAQLDLSEKLQGFQHEREMAGMELQGKELELKGAESEADVRLNEMKLEADERKQAEIERSNKARENLDDAKHKLDQAREGRLEMDSKSRRAYERVLTSQGQIAIDQATKLTAKDTLGNHLSVGLDLPQQVADLLKTAIPKDMEKVVTYEQAQKFAQKFSENPQIYLHTLVAQLTENSQKLDERVKAIALNDTMSDEEKAAAAQDAAQEHAPVIQALDTMQMLVGKTKEITPEDMKTFMTEAVKTRNALIKEGHDPASLNLDAMVREIVTAAQQYRNAWYAPLSQAAAHVKQSLALLESGGAKQFPTAEEYSRDYNRKEQGPPLVAAERMRKAGVPEETVTKFLGLQGVKTKAPKKEKEEDTGEKTDDRQRLKEELSKAIKEGREEEAQELTNILAEKSSEMLKKRVDEFFSKGADERAAYLKKRYGAPSAR